MSICCPNCGYPLQQSYPLTERQKEAFEVIKELSVGGICPSYDEICVALGLKSKSGVHRLVTGLIERGHLRKLSGRRRTLQIISDIPASRAA